MNIPLAAEVDNAPIRLDMFISTGGAYPEENWQESRVHLDVQRYVKPVCSFRVSLSDFR